MIIVYREQDKELLHKFGSIKGNVPFYVVDEDTIICNLGLHEGAITLATSLNTFIRLLTSSETNSDVLQYIKHSASHGIKVIIDSTSYPLGLYYIPNAINSNDAKELIDKLDEEEWIGVSESANGRKVQHYGYYYDYKSRRIDAPAKPIPDFLRDLVGIAKDTCTQLKLEDKFNQMIVNRYEPGQGISAHTDHLSYGPVICCFTIGSGGILKFVLPSTGETREVYTQPGSMYIMSGDARYKYVHSMPSRKSDTVDGKRITRGIRISITLRNVPNK